ncbi:MAG TPA: hypothetical protein VKB88_08870 [Bryobacteraceae bacterium]|nr:hypothetical protein [Bryobacteraceae bacterium]
MYPTHRSDDERLDALFRAYRTACPDRDPSTNFMPELWQRIEARQTFTFSFRRMANAFVTAGLALTVMLGVYMALPQKSSYYPVSYLQALADTNSPETPDIVGPVGLDFTDPGR